MFGIFKPAEHVAPIQDTAVVKKKYRYWQFRTLYSMYAGYVVYYFTRKNLPIALPFMMKSLGFSKTDLGWVLTASSLAYGLSKFTSGIVSDRSNPRYFMAFGLVITGILNICFGLSSTLPVLALVWGINGWFQGCGWPPCSRLLTHWYAHKERARWWAVWNTSHNLGGFLIPLLTVWAISHFGDWRWGMFIPGVMAIIVGLFLMNRLRDTPQSLGLPPIEVFSGQGKVKDEEHELSTRELLVKYVLTNRSIWLLAAAYFFVYFVRQAINDWSVVFLTEIKGYEIIAATGVVALFEVGGLFGSLVSGYLSDVVFKGKRGPVNVLFSIACVLAVTGFWMLPASHWIMACGIMFSIGFFVFGPQMLIGIAAAELSHKKAAATATGFCGFFAYVGAAAAGAPVAHVAQSLGWQAFFTTVAAAGVIMVLLLVPLWNKTRFKEMPVDVDVDADAEVAPS